jgi:hypothetical protein
MNERRIDALIDDLMFATLDGRDRHPDAAWDARDALQEAIAEYRTPEREPSDNDECANCHRTRREHQHGYSASRCTFRLVAATEQPAPPSAPLAIDNAKIVRNALALSRSVHLSGESWSRYCDEAFVNAKHALERMDAALRAAEQREPDGWVVEGHIWDGEWSPIHHALDMDDAQAFVDEHPKWRVAGVRIRPVYFGAAKAAESEE